MPAIASATPHRDSPTDSRLPSMNRSMDAARLACGQVATAAAASLSSSSVTSRSRNAASALTTPGTIPRSTACWTSAAGMDAGPHSVATGSPRVGRTQKAAHAPCPLDRPQDAGGGERRTPDRDAVRQHGGRARQHRIGIDEERPRAELAVPPLRSGVDQALTAYRPRPGCRSTPAFTSATSIGADSPAAVGLGRREHAALAICGGDQLGVQRARRPGGAGCGPRQRARSIRRS